MTVFFINPFLGAVGGDFESIATVTVGGGGASSIEFTSIPGTYQHLQVRALAKESGGTSSYTLLVQYNADTGVNYARHLLEGSGTAASAASGTSTSTHWAFNVAAGNKTYFGAGVMDILDYASTTKYKTVRTFGGSDQNGSGFVGVYSGLWMDTSAITSIKLVAPFSGFVEHSTAALFGIKA
jgi:hypothetical protein